MTEIQKTEGEIKVLQAKLELLKEMEKHKTPCEEAFKDWMGVYPPTNPSVDNIFDIRWRAFQMGYNAAYEEKVAQEPEETTESLRNAMRTAKEEGVFDEPEYYDELVENGVSENKQKPKTLYSIIDRWWMDIFCNPIYRDWDMETSIQDLVDRIEFWNMRIKNDDDEVELDEQENDKNFKNSLDLIKEWGEKNKPPTLKELLCEWWINHLDMEQSDEEIIDYLVNIIDKKFIPPSSDTNGYEWEKCLKMMRDKLR
jgi:hypothetical protein